MRIRLFPALVALLIGVPLLDSLMLLFFGRYIGFWITVAFVLLSGFAGAGLVKSQGLRAWHGIQRDFANGRMPAEGLMDAVVILVSGGLLMAPGFVTDIIGLVLLVPAIRTPIKALVRRRIERATVQRFGFYPGPEIRL